MGSLQCKTSNANPEFTTQLHLLHLHSVHILQHIAPVFQMLSFSTSSVHMKPIHKLHLLIEHCTCQQNKQILEKARPLDSSEVISLERGFGHP